MFARIKRTDFDFRVRIDEEKKEYVVLKSDLLTKNSPGVISYCEFKSRGGSGMLKDKVQVQALRRLLARLHPNQLGKDVPARASRGKERQRAQRYDAFVVCQSETFKPIPITAFARA